MAKRAMTRWPSYTAALNSPCPYIGTRASKSEKIPPPLRSLLDTFFVKRDLRGGAIWREKRGSARSEVQGVSVDLGTHLTEPGGAR